MSPFFREIFCLHDYVLFNAWSHSQGKWIIVFACRKCKKVKP